MNIWWLNPYFHNRATGSSCKKYVSINITRLLVSESVWLGKECPCHALGARLHACVTPAALLSPVINRITIPITYWVSTMTTMLIQSKDLWNVETIILLELVLTCFTTRLDIGIWRERGSTAKKGYAQGLRASTMWHSQWVLRHKLVLYNNSEDWVGSVGFSGIRG